MARPAAALTYSVPEAAAALGIGRPAVWDLIRRGDIPALRIGRRVVISRHALEQWVTDHAADTFPTINQKDPAGTQPAGS